RDVVTLDCPARLQNTLYREIRTTQMSRQIADNRDSALNVQRQFSTLLNNVPDAIAHVQEGIIVETNKAWLELFGRKTDEDVIATPFMDAFAKPSQPAVKGALVAISKQKWNNESLDVEIVRTDGRSVAQSVQLQGAVFDDEPAVRVAIKPDEQEDKRVSKLMRDAVNKDHSTFLYHRKHFQKLVDKRMQMPLESGQRLMAWIRIDKFKNIRNDLGVILSEDVIAEFAELLRQKLTQQDIAGRFEGTAFTVLLERGSERDAENWARAFTKLVADSVFSAGERTVNLTCTMGIAPQSPLTNDAASLIELAEQTFRQAHSTGDTGIVCMEESNDEDTRIRRTDEIWSRRLTDALKDNRFRLVQQPIGALDGQPTGMCDILLRLVDEQNEVVPPADFLPSARRTNMMHALDRWVIATSIALTRQQQSRLLFVRVSEQSAVDKSFYAWLKALISKTAERPDALCFQFSEDLALKYLKAASHLANFVKSIGCKFALEHSGTAEQSTKLISQMPMDFVKVDGSLITSLSKDSEAHQRTTDLVQIAKARGIETIAEQVQDANTMAALWQLGIGYMQGHYVQEPEVVLQESA
ncbi:MAG: EAL domain-containing protein, partial [Pseudomonadota bacterium]